MADTNAMLQIMQQQKEFMQQQSELFKKVFATMTKKEPGEIYGESSHDIVLETLANSITEFQFDAESGKTLANWFARYEDVFKEDGKKLDDNAKTRLLLRKLETHSKYADYILPKNPRDNNFDETVKILSVMFAKKVSLFHSRYNCLKTTISEVQDFVSYAGTVNRECENFKLSEIIAQISLSALYLFVDSVRINSLIFEQDCYQRLKPNQIRLYKH